MNVTLSNGLDYCYMQSTPALLVSYLYSTVQSKPLGGRFITSQSLGEGVLNES
jgi:hypothetical protein